MQYTTTTTNNNNTMMMTATTSSKEEDAYLGKLQKKKELVYDMLLTCKNKKRWK